MPSGFRKDGSKLGFQKGHTINNNRTPWNKDIETGFMSKNPELTREKCRLSGLGNKSNLGRKLPQSHRDNISKGVKGRIPPLSERQKKSILFSGSGNPMFGRTGEKHPRWLGGISFEPYTSEFNGQLKELIRRRDNYQCQKCGCPEVENIRKLDVHHIDYDKKNNDRNNLISLCAKCNSGVNKDRKKWEKHFKFVLKMRQDVYLLC